MTAPVENVAEKMRREWDERAEKDAKFYIATGHAASDEAFRASGEADLDGAILNGIALAKEASALEIGCGVGRLLVPLSRRVAKVAGVDISPSMIERSKEYIASRSNVTTAVTGGRLDGVADGSLDFVYSFIVFQHIPALEPIATYVAEASRVLAPGGVLRFQVDGRAWRWRGREATTYDGMKFTPEAARALLDGTRLAIVDEWGGDTHYHWITAKKSGTNPKVSVSRRVFDETLLEDLLSRCDVKAPRETASRVVSRAMSLRRALGPMDGGRAASGTSDHDFVRSTAERVLGAPASDSWVAAQVEVLSKGHEERADLVDVLFLGRELRDLVHPLDVEVPWWRREGVRLATGVDASSFLDLASAVETSLAARSGEDAVVAAFEWILGERPAADAALYHARLLSESPRGRRLLARRLLSVDADALAPLDAERSRSLLDRAGLPPGDVGSVDARVARRLLDDGASLDDLSFVRRGYVSILGREADDDGAAYYAGKLRARALTRPTFLRELLSSAELRGS